MADPRAPGEENPRATGEEDPPAARGGSPQPGRKLPSRSEESDRPNHWALVTLFCGIISWVPWVVVFAAPLTFAFALLTFWQARKKNRRRHLPAAVFGVFLSIVAVVIQLAIVLLGGIVGLIGGA